MKVVLQQTHITEQNMRIHQKIHLSSAKMSKDNKPGHSPNLCNIEITKTPRAQIMISNRLL